MAILTDGMVDVVQIGAVPVTPNDYEVIGGLIPVQLFLGNVTISGDGLMITRANGSDLGLALRAATTLLGGVSEGAAKRVVLMTFSEFGRRVGENGSKGTDHGSGSSLFVAGPSVKGGLVGKHPSLKSGDLDRGDLKMSCDFRSVYQAVLGDWLKMEPVKILGKRYPNIPLF